MESKLGSSNLKKRYGITFKDLIRSSRTSHTFAYIIAIIWVVFFANLCLNMFGFTLYGLSRLGNWNVFNAFMVITIISIIPIILITIIQNITLANGVEHTARISDIKMARKHLVVEYVYHKDNVVFNKSRMIKIKRIIDMSYFTRGREEAIVIHKSNPAFSVFIVSKFINRN